MQVTPEDFITAWQTSESVGEVAEKLGGSTVGMSSRACDYRRRGIPLKRMPTNKAKGRKSLDITQLSALAESLNSKPTSGESQ